MLLLNFGLAPGPTAATCVWIPPAQAVAGTNNNNSMYVRTYTRDDTTGTYWLRKLFRRRRERKFNNGKVSYLSADSSSSLRSRFSLSLWLFFLAERDFWISPSATNK